MKIFSLKNGSAAISNWIFWLLFVVAVGIGALMIAYVLNISVAEASRIPVGLEDELILASRFYNSEKCFAYQDEFRRIHKGVIDISEFTQENMEDCFQGSNVKYSFSLVLPVPSTSSNPGPHLPIDINTSNWDEEKIATKVINEDILIFSGNGILTKEKLTIAIQNVK